jgi:hypothetical protein
MRASRSLVVLTAAVLAVSSLAVAGPPPSKASRADYNKAQAMFEKAKKQYEAGKVDVALDGFRASYDVVASPITHLFQARALAALGQSVEAYATFTEVLAESETEGAVDKRYRETHDAAMQERGELSSKVALVAVNVNRAPADATLKIAGKPIARARWSDPVAVAAGSVTVSLDAAGGLHAEKTTAASVGSRADVTIELSDGSPAPVASAPPAAPADDGASTRDKLRIASYVAGGVGVAGLVTFAVAGSLARSRFHTLQDECGGTCPPSRQSDVDGGRHMTTLANIGLGVGIVGVGAGVTLFVLSRGGDEKPAATGPSARAVVGPGFVGLDGRF